MIRKNLSLKLAVLLLACGGLGAVFNFTNSVSVYAMEGKDRQNQNDGSNDGLFDRFLNTPLNLTPEEKQKLDSLTPEERQELYNEMCCEVQREYSRLQYRYYDGPITDKEKQQLKDELVKERNNIIKNGILRLENHEKMNNRNQYDNEGSHLIRSCYPIYCDPTNRNKIEPVYGFEQKGRFPVRGMYGAEYEEDSDYSKAIKKCFCKYEENVGGRDSGFRELLNSIKQCVESLSDYFKDMDKVNKAFYDKFNFSEDEVKRNRELVIAKEKELEEAKKQLAKLSKCSLSRPEISSSEIASLQKLIEQKWHELNEARKKLPENLHFENEVNKFDDQLNKNVVASVGNSIVSRYGNEDLFFAVNAVLLSLKNFYDHVEKKYKEFAEKAKDIYTNDYNTYVGKQSKHKHAKSTLRKYVKVFEVVVDKCIYKVFCYIGSPHQAGQWMRPSLYDLFTDFSDRKVDDLTPIELKNKGLFKKLFGEKFAEHCKNEIKKFSGMTSRYYNVLVDNIIDFYNLDPESKIKKSKQQGEEVKPSVLLSLFEGTEESEERFSRGKKMKNKSEELVFNELKADYEKERGLYPGVELFPENVKLLQLGKKRKKSVAEGIEIFKNIKKIKEFSKKIKEFNENKGLSGKFGKDLSDEEYLNSGFFEIDAMRYNDDLKAEYLSKNKTGVQSKPATLTAPINVINNNLGTEPTVNLLPKNIDEASNEQLKGFKEFLSDEHKKCFVCDMFKEISIRDAVRSDYEDYDYGYVAEYNEYLLKNKTGAKPNQAKLNASPVLATPTNVVNNNVDAEPSANLLPANINDASLEQLQRFRLFLANEYKFNFICDPNNINSLKEALEEHYDEYVSKYNEYLLKNKNGAKPSLVLATPINVVNNNVDADPSANLLPANINDASLEQLQRFRLFLANEYKFNFICDPNNINSLKEALEEHYDEYVSKYNEYLLKNKNGAKPSPVLATPINVVNNNVDDKNNLELKGNVSEIPVEYLNRFRAYVANNHIYDDPAIARALDLDVVDFVKEYLPKYMNEYYAYLEKNKTVAQPSPVLAAPINVVNNNVGVEPSVNLLPVNVVGNLDNGNNTENKPKKEIEFITKKRKKTDN